MTESRARSFGSPQGKGFNPASPHCTRERASHLYQLFMKKHRTSVLAIAPLSVRGFVRFRTKHSQARGRWRMMRL